MTNDKTLRGVVPGMRLRFKTDEGIKVGTVERIDGSSFLGDVIIREDDGTEHRVPILFAEA